MKHLERRKQLLVTYGAELKHTSGDQTDRPSFSHLERELLKYDEEPVDVLSVIMTGISMFTYATDIFSSAVLCYWLYGTGRWWWIVTLGSLLASLVVVNVFSIRWYIHDTQEGKDYLPPVSPAHWILRGLFHLGLLGPIIRYLELFIYGLHTCDRKDPNRQQFRLMFLQEDRDTSLLALVGSFIKSAPLLILQMYILAQKRIPVNLPTTRAQAANLVISLVELSLAQSSYHKALRRSTPLKRNMTKIGAAVQFLSHCCVIASRVLALSSFACLYGHWLFVFCAFHWILMTTWLIFQRTSFCATSLGEPRPFEEIIFVLVLGGIYLFCFINVKDEPTRWKYTFYYTIIWVENVVLVVLWYMRADPDLWFRIPLLCSVLISLAAGLVLLTVYYRFLHPNKIWEKLQK